MGGLSHPLSCGLIAIMVFAMATYPIISVVWLKQIEQTRSDYRLRDNAASPRPL